MSKSKGWEPHWGYCAKCGKDLWLSSPQKAYCDECIALNKKIRDWQYWHGPMAKYESKEEIAEKKRKAAEAAERARERREKHVCKVTDKCIYGIKSGQAGYCNYSTVTRKLRAVNGEHIIKDGKCDLFQPGPHISSKEIIIRKGGDNDKV